MVNYSPNFKQELIIHSRALNFYKQTKLRSVSFIIIFIIIQTAKFVFDQSTFALFGAIILFFSNYSA